MQPRPHLTLFRLALDNLFQLDLPYKAIRLERVDVISIKSLKAPTAFNSPFLLLSIYILPQNPGRNNNRFFMLCYCITLCEWINKYYFHQKCFAVCFVLLYTQAKHSLKGNAFKPCLHVAAYRQTAELQWSESLKQESFNL